MNGASARSPLMILMAVAVAATLVFVGVLGWHSRQRDQERARQAAAELAAADQARSEQIRAEAQTARTAEAGQRTARNEIAVRNALRNLSSDQPMAQCEGALALGRMRVHDEVRRLETLMDSSGYSSVRTCAASALVDLGETEITMHAYQKWVRDEDPDLQRSAIMGFGEIGPAAADAAIPHLTDALKSPQMDMRYLAVESLSKLGPAARPLLQVAAGDTDIRVRTRATQVLTGRR